LLPLIPRHVLPVLRPKRIKEHEHKIPQYIPRLKKEPSNGTPAKKTEDERQIKNRNIPDLAERYPEPSDEDQSKSPEDSDSHMSEQNESNRINEDD
jgi:hypothetical protein